MMNTPLLASKSTQLDYHRPTWVQAMKGQQLFGSKVEQMMKPMKTS
jgi:hypothetical protein